MEGTWLDIFDLLLGPMYVIAIFLYARNLVYKNIRNKPHYKYLVPALMCKIFGGIALCLIYTYYYTYGGDVTNYYISATTFSNVLLEGHFSKFFEMLDYKNTNIYDVLAYNNIYGYFMFSPGDYYALFTVCLTVPFCIVGFKSMIATTVLLASVSFIGLWKLYEVFLTQFPDLKKQFAIGIFFIPSVFFWGSGILKDTYTLSAIGFYIYGLYYFQIQKQRKLKYLMMIIFL